MSTGVDSPRARTTRIHPLVFHGGIGLRAVGGGAVDEFVSLFRRTWRAIPGDGQRWLHRTWTMGRLMTLVDLVTTWSDTSIPSPPDTPFGTVAGKSVTYCGPALATLPPHLARVALAEPLARVVAASILRSHRIPWQQGTEHALETQLWGRYGDRSGPAELRAAAAEILHAWKFRPQKLTAWLEAAENRERLDEVLAGRQATPPLTAS